ncbi:hypothetical protein ACO22_05776 [Paracoccidioides brasiliensis]|uniref:Altered inheritance of mitochondria protein 41 n=1 Tax=Paracoccidioides brasiliensis TaxID=121759 RepID=A0A1D2J9M7_PARBR|nr:hypothetical protein ACO22_05776 [Paracoccidioides brasiliensis]
MFRSPSIRPQLCLRGSIRHNSTAPVTPPLLLKIKSDLKDAMRAKDTSRLNVLRALISETTNASKTSSPIKTDLQLLILMRKRAAALKDAKSEYNQAGRADLSDNADKEIQVLDGYASQVETTSAEEIQSAVSKAIAELQSTGEKVVVGSVIKALVGRGGLLEGKPVETAQIIGIANEFIPKK